MDAPIGFGAAFGFCFFGGADMPVARASPRATSVAFQDDVLEPAIARQVLKAQVTGPCTGGDCAVLKSMIGPVGPLARKRPQSRG